jgi:hypothetical protein
VIEAAVGRVGQERPAAWTPRHGPNRARVSILAALAVVLASCGGRAPAASAEANALGATGGPPTANAAATPEATAASPSPSTGTDSCTPNTPTQASQSWTQLTGLDGDYRFSRPGDWTDLGSAIAIPANRSVSPATFSQTGLKADARIAVDVVRSADTLTVISAWALDGVTSETSRLFDDELAWLRSQPQLTAVRDDALRACLDGTPARGFSSVWTADSGDKAVLMYVAQRDGTMYEIQMTAGDTLRSGILDEVFRTWKWNSADGSGTPEDISAQLAATEFAAFATAGKLDNSGEHPNPATFKTTFPATAKRIWILYELDDGIHDMVSLTWRHEGRQVGKPVSFDYTGKSAFAWGWLTPDPITHRFVPGNYEVTATLRDAGDSITLAFTVE